MKKLREETSGLITIIENQNSEISQLKYFKDSYEKNKQERAALESKHAEQLTIYCQEIEYNKQIQDDNLAKIANLQT